MMDYMKHNSSLYFSDMRATVVTAQYTGNILISIHLMLTHVAIMNSTIHCNQGSNHKVPQMLMLRK